MSRGTKTISKLESIVFVENKHYNKTKIPHAIRHKINKRKRLLKQRKRSPNDEFTNNKIDNGIECLLLKLMYP